MIAEGFRFKDWCRRCNGYTDHVIIKLRNSNDMLGSCVHH